VKVDNGFAFLTAGVLVSDMLPLGGVSLVSTMRTVCHEPSFR
jgi:hypothetical protein